LADLHRKQPEEEDGPVEKKPRHVPCPACLGVLQDSFMMPRYRYSLIDCSFTGEGPERFLLDAKRLID
jgi:hypothetical protein